MRRERPATAIRLAVPAALVSLVATVGAATGGTPPPCAPQGWGLEQRVVPTARQRPSEVALTAGWLTGTESRRACLLRTTIRVSVAGSGGAAISADWKVDAVLRPWSGVVHTWVWKNWCDTGSPDEATVAFSAPGGKSLQQSVHSPPTCVDAAAPTTVTGLGTGTKHVTRPGGRMPPHVLPAHTPSPFAAAVLKPKNAWLVSDGYTLVAVYAGSPGEDASLGRFGIVRQNLIFGIQYPPDIVDAGRIGAVRITSAPRGRSRESSAQHSLLHFVSADGTRGVLELTGDRVRFVTRGH